MSVFCGIGDLHLSSTNGYGGFSRFIQKSDEYILSEVQKVVSHCNSLGIDQFFIYGDICDSPRMSYTAHLQLLEFFRLNKDSEFHLILGNHDKLAVDASVGHSMEVFNQFNLKNCHLYIDPTVVDFGDCKVNFLSYPYSDFKKMLNVCHLDISGARNDNGRLVKGVDPQKYQIVSGHIHSAGDYKRVHYSGTLYQLNFGESISRKGYHVIDCTGSDVDVQWVPWKPKYELCDLELNNCSKIPQNTVNKFYRILLTEDIDPSVYANLNVVSIKNCSAKELKQLELKFEQLDLDPSELFNKFISGLPEKEQTALLNVRNKVLGL